MRVKMILLVGWVTLAMGMAGLGGVSGLDLPPVEELPYAVVLRETFLLSFPGPGVEGGGVLLGVHDLNGDGVADLVVAGDRRVQVWFGDGQGKFSPGPWVYLEVERYVEGMPIPVRHVVEAGEIRVQPYELEEQEGVLFVPLNVSPVFGGAVVDLDGDGILDLVVHGYGGPQEERGLRLYFLRGIGGGQFARAGSIPHPRWITKFMVVNSEVLFRVKERDELTGLYRIDVAEGLESPQLVKVAEGPWTLHWVGDLTGDGLFDLVVSSQERVQVLVGEEGGFKEGPQFISPAGKVRGVEVADLDGNGFLDLVVLSYTGIVAALWRGDEYKEAFSRDLGMPLSSWAAVADLNGDKIPDLLVQRETGFSEYLFLPGEGQGKFLDPVLALVVPDGILMRPCLADLNSDGLLDVIFSPDPFPGKRIRVYLSGGALPGTSLHPLPGALLAVGDLLGNGSPDVLTADVKQQGVGVFWNNGRGGLIYRPLAALGDLPMAGVITPGVAYVLLPATKQRPCELVAITNTGKILNRWWVSPDSLPVVVAADLDGDRLVDVAIPAKGELVVLWDSQDLRTYPWPMGEISFLAPGDGNLWAVSIEEYADLVQVRFPNRELEVSAPLLRLEALPLAMTVGDLDGDGIQDPVVLGVEVGVKVEEERAVLFPERVVAGLVLSRTGPVVEEVPGFPKDHLPWPFLGVAVAGIAGTPHLIHTTSAGGGVFLVPWRGGFGEPIRLDVPGGPVFAADLDGNGEAEVLTSTVGLAPLLVLLWNGGGR